jgi:hypothetical protein
MRRTWRRLSRTVWSFPLAMAPFSCDDADHRHRSYDFGYSWKIDGDASVPTFSCEDVTKERHLPGSLVVPLVFSGALFYCGLFRALPRLSFLRRFSSM